MCPRQDPQYGYDLNKKIWEGQIPSRRTTQFLEGNDEQHRGMKNQVQIFSGILHLLISLSELSFFTSFYTLTSLVFPFFRFIY